MTQGTLHRSPQINKAFLVLDLDGHAIEVAAP
jgi:hypothetical protein